MFTTVVEVVQIAFHTIGIRLLNAAASGGVIVRDSETYHGLVVEVYRFLYQSFTKGTATHHQATVPILDAAGNDFGSRGGTLIN